MRWWASGRIVGGVLLALALGGAAGAVPGPGDSCTLYAAQDTGGATNQMLRVDLIDPVTGDPLHDLVLLGPPCTDCDIEALGLSPFSGVLFGFSGGNGNRTGDPLDRGDFFEADKSTGALTILGNTGYVMTAEEVVSASFRETDASLWVFVQGLGLVTVDVFDGTPTLQYDARPEQDQFGNGVPLNWEGLAWSPDESFLYGVNSRRLLRWDPLTATTELVCDDMLPLGDELEALEFRPEGGMVGSWQSLLGHKIVEISFPTDPALFGAGACALTDIGNQILTGPDLDFFLSHELASLVFEPCPKRKKGCGLGGELLALLLPLLWLRRFVERPLPRS